MFSLFSTFLILGFVFGVTASAVLWFCYVLFNDATQSALIPK